jgi:hypothetical protein
MGAREGMEYAATTHAMAHRTEDGIQLTESTYVENWRDKIRERDEMYEN